jgi:hypothetical protein
MKTLKERDGLQRILRHADSMSARAGARMKKIIFSLTFIFTISFGTAQSSNVLNDMINDCLNDCLNHFLNHSLPLMQTRTQIITPALLSDYYPFYFDISDSVKSTLKNNPQCKIVSFYKPKFRKYFKKERCVLFFDGVYLDSNKLIIKFSERSVQYKAKGRMTYIGISDWYKYIYEYSSEEKRWVLIEKILEGI